MQALRALRPGLPRGDDLSPALRGPTSLHCVARCIMLGTLGNHREQIPSFRRLLGLSWDTRESRRMISAPLSIGTRSLLGILAPDSPREVAS